MSNPSRFLAITAALLLALSSTSLAHAARSSDPPARSSHADPSGRVARLSHIQGEISYSPAGEDEWVDAERNRPLIRGDRLWTDRNARAELQVGNAAVRLGADTSFEILNLNDRVAQVRLTQGTLNLRVRRLYPGQSYEVATPTLAFTVNRPGRYRIDVDEHDDETTVVVWEGAGKAYGDNTSFRLRAGDAVRFYGGDLRDHELSGLPRADAFDRYCLGRDRRLDRSASLRYLDDDVVGYADLDDYGSWRPVRGHGTVWFPTSVSVGWAPYRDGHWVWQEPWGWTWVDNAPWGFAPSHYGRWVHVSNRWGWLPGPRNVRPVYAPALVAFVGGRGWSVSLSFGARAPIGWFPLAPREVYVPSYSASRDYFTRVNVNNTVVNNTTITNVYNNNYINTTNINTTNTTTNINTTNVTQVNYANRAVPGAVTAVPSAVFVNAQPVQPAAIRIEGAAVTTAEVTRIAPVAPSARSVLGPGEATRTRPSREVQDRPVVAHSAPPPAERPFAARERQLQQTPGQAPEPAPVQATPGGTVAIAPNVRVIAEQPGAVDARAAGSRRRGARDAARTDGPLPPLEREQRQEQGAAPPPTASEPQAAAQQRAAEQEQRQRKAEGEQALKEEQAGRQRQAERERQVAAQHQAEQQRLVQEQEKQRQGKAEGEQRQVAEQQRIERERLANQQQQEQRRLKAEGDAQIAEQQRAESKQQEQRQHKAEGEQQAQKEAQAGRQRKADSEQQALKEAQAGRQRKADSEQQAAQAAAQQRAAAAEQEQRQRKAEGEQQALKEEQAGRQRQAERERQVAAQHQAEQQRLAQEQDKQRQGKAESEQRQVAEQQRVERERLANQQQQEQRRLKAEGEAQAVERERAERERVAEARRLEQAECERLAVERKQDKRQCRNGTPAKPPRADKGNPSRADAGPGGN